MTKDQQMVAKGAIIGIVSMVVGVLVLTLILPAPAISDTLIERIVYALQMNLLAMLPLFIMLVTLGNGRFMSKAIDPLKHAEDKEMEIDDRVADNTLQQQTVFFVSSLALATVVPFAFLNVIGAAALVYIVARITFWKGYHLHPLLRAPGMAATGYLNLGIILATLYLLFF